MQPAYNSKSMNQKNVYLLSLIIYVQVNSFSVMLEQVFLGLTSTKQRIQTYPAGKELKQGHDQVDRS